MKSKLHSHPADVYSWQKVGYGTTADNIDVDMILDENSSVLLVENA